MPKAEQVGLFNPDSNVTPTQYALRKAHTHNYRSCTGLGPYGLNKRPTQNFLPVVIRGLH